MGPLTYIQPTYIGLYFVHIYASKRYNLAYDSSRPTQRVMRLLSLYTDVHTGDPSRWIRRGPETSDMHAGLPGTVRMILRILPLLECDLTWASRKCTRTARERSRQIGHNINNARENCVCVHLNARVPKRQTRILFIIHVTFIFVIQLAQLQQPVYVYTSTLNIGIPLI